MPARTWNIRGSTNHNGLSIEEGSLKNVVYMAINTVTNKKYIGQTITRVHIRISQHIREAGSPKYENYDSYLNRSIRKHGIENFTWVILKKCSNVEELNEGEKFYIKEYDSNNPAKGYNQTGGGKHSFTITQEAIDKMRAANIGRIPWNKGIPMTEETKEKVVASLKTVDMGAWNRGRKQTEEHKKNSSEAHLGVFKGEKHPLFGKPRSEETKKLISDKKTGVPYTGNNIVKMRGIWGSTEHRNKLSAGQKGAWKKEGYKEKMSDIHCKLSCQLVSPDGVVYTVNNIKKFCGEQGLDSGAIYSLLKGRGKSSRGWSVFKAVA